MIIGKSIFSLFLCRQINVHRLLFSVQKSLSQETFALVMKRLQQSSETSKKIGTQLIQMASKEIQSSNSEALRIEMNKLSPIVSIHQELASLINNIKDLEEMLKQTTDKQQKSILETQKTELLTKKQQLKMNAIQLLIPPDSYDEFSQVYLQFRPGAGGSQAAIFVQDLSQMITSYCDSQGWRVSVLNSIKQTTASKGYKYLRLKVAGQGVYKTLKCESGVHKVIRVPQTQAKGRLHSSTISMVVMPSIPFNFSIDMKDIKFQYTRSSGAGGQSVQKTDSACRATYIPTGLSVFIQQQRSQDQNKKRAVQILKQRLFEAEYQKTIQEESKRRKIQIGTMDRSEKIRTYNYPQDRITDHRTGLTLFGIQNMMCGGLLQNFIDSYMNKLYEQKLENLINQLKQSKFK